MDPEPRSTALLRTVKSKGFDEVAQLSQSARRQEPEDVGENPTLVTITMKSNWQTTAGDIAAQVKRILDSGLTPRVINIVVKEKDDRKHNSEPSPLQ